MNIRENNRAGQEALIMCLGASDVHRHQSCEQRYRRGTWESPACERSIPCSSAPDRACLRGFNWVSIVPSPRSLEATRQRQGRSLYPLKGQARRAGGKCWAGTSLTRATPGPMETCIFSIGKRDHLLSINLQRPNRQPGRMESPLVESFPFRKILWQIS
jgi:hypothetical protein